MILKELNEGWQSLLQADLQFIWSTHTYIYELDNWLGGGRHRPISGFLNKIVSKHPLKDISLTTWFVFVAALQVYGFPFFWVCVTNLAVAGTLRVFIEAPRPFMHDVRLRPLADRHPTSHGFPSLETHMAVVVWGYIACHVDHPLMWLTTVFVVSFISFTRIYACSRSAHQLVGSWVTGALGVHHGFNLLRYLESLQLHYKHHLFGCTFVVIVALGMLALWVETNQSNFVRVPKQEFVRVLTHVMQSGTQGQDVLDMDAELLNDDDDTGDDADDGATGSARRRSKGGAAAASRGGGVGLGLGMQGPRRGQGQAGNNRSADVRSKGGRVVGRGDGSEIGRDSASDLEGERFRPGGGGGGGGGTGAADRLRQKQRAERKDSFYFLQRTVQYRTDEAKFIQHNVAYQKQQQQYQYLQRELQLQEKLKRQESHRTPYRS